MEDVIGIPTLKDLSKEDLEGKTIFIRCDFNVPMEPANHKNYRVADDTRIRRFLDLTFHTIHELTKGNCRIIIGSHLGRPHKEKDHSRWDGIYNMQFVSTHFDTLIHERYKDIYTVFPPEIIDSHLKTSLEIFKNHQMPIGTIKFLPNLRYLLDPEKPDSYRDEFIVDLSEVSEIFVNCGFGCSHRQTKSIMMLPGNMREQKKLAVSGMLLHEEIKQLGEFGARVLADPRKTLVIAGGSKIADKMGILKEFVRTKIRRIFIAGKMANSFLLAKDLTEKIDSLSREDIPARLLVNSDEGNKAVLKEIELAAEILKLAEEKEVEILLPEDYKVVEDYMDKEIQIKESPDFSKELQLDLGPRTIVNYPQKVLEGIENFFWNGPLGAYDHPETEAYAEGSVELAKSLFCAAMQNQNISVVIGGGDSAAILNKIPLNDMLDQLKKNLLNQLSSAINRTKLNLDFDAKDTYNLFNYLTSNFFVSTGGGASLEFLEKFLKNQGRPQWASYLPGTAALMEGSAPSVNIKSERESKVSAV